MTYPCYPHKIGNQWVTELHDYADGLTAILGVFAWTEADCIARSLYWCRRMDAQKWMDARGY